MTLSEGRGLKTPGREDMGSSSALGGSRWLPGGEPARARPESAYRTFPDQAHQEGRWPSESWAPGYHKVVTF